MDRIKAVISHVEKHLPQSTCIDDLAHLVKLSRWHLQRAFKQATGLSIGQYIRSRRLSLAAIDLASSDKRILDIAIEYGFESQEAFARAFKKRFGLAPKRFKGQVEMAKMSGTEVFDEVYLENFSKLSQLKATKVILPAANYAGLLRSFTSPKLDHDGFYQQLDLLWQDFIAKSENQQGLIGDNYTLVYWVGSSQQTGNFTMMAAKPMLPDNDALAGLAKVHVAEREYLCFNLDADINLNHFLSYIYNFWLTEHDYAPYGFPTIWRSYDEGRIEYLVNVRKIDSNAVRPKRLTINPKLTRLPAFQVEGRKKTISYCQTSAVERLGFIRDLWCQPNPSLQHSAEVSGFYKAVLIGDRGYRPLDQFDCTVSTVVRQGGNITIERQEYLDCICSGSLEELGECTDYIFCWFLPQSEYYAVPGYEIITDFTQDKQKTYSLRYLIPVCRKGVNSLILLLNTEAMLSKGISYVIWVT